MCVAASLSVPPFPRQVEEKLKRYQAKNEELKIACDAKSRQISKLRTQNITLMNMATCGTESGSTVRHLEDLLNTEKSKTTSLMARITELEEAAAAHPGL